MDASKSRSKKNDAGISERLGLFVASSLQVEPPIAKGSEQADVREFVSRQIVQCSGSLRKRLAIEEQAAAADPGYIVDSFSRRDPRRGPVAARRG